MYAQPIRLEKAANIRDLGGMIGQDGRAIRPKRLIRGSSLSLNHCSLHDLDKLTREYHVREVVDLRNPMEIEEDPDFILKGMNYTVFSIFAKTMEGITHEQAEAEKRNRLESHQKPLLAHQRMILSYIRQASSRSVQQCYHDFILLLLRMKPDEACLWHCAIGKDRTGLVSVVTELLLGVDRESITEDYLYTNTVYHGSRAPEKTCEDYFGYALKEYLDAFLDTILKEFGNFENYFRQGLKISEEQQKQLQELFLEAR